ncbi:MAG: thiamine pyrophosphate-dependent dehydrogenase E1 component subunit alpha [Sandaracinaceae bacterium]|nr:thiamine pyrophosphate-dependent dehydrogenase E1 component subunit alpha [Sandaracinaceae bacterium]
MDEREEPALGLFQILNEEGFLTREGFEFEQSLLLRMFREMLRIRRIDERMLAKQRQGKIGFYGTITGQEAVPVASGLAIEAQDWVFPALRESAIMLVRGFPLVTWLAQVYGNEADLQKGRQMPSHQAGRAVNQVAWSSCIGTQLPQAVGAAMAAKRRGDPTVVLAFLGDGATSESDFHSAMNFAAIERPPVVLICQNNQWAISVPVSKQSASRTIAIKAKAYGLPGVRVDGNDVLASYVSIRQAVERARKGGGPTFIECLTYRMGPHSSSDDPTRYRSHAEVAEWEKRDPIVRLERFLRQRGLLDDAQKSAIEEELSRELEEAIRAVEGMPLPPRESLFEDVYAAPLPWHLKEEREALLGLPRALEAPHS